MKYETQYSTSVGPTILQVSQGIAVVERSETRKRLSGLQLPAPKNNDEALLSKDNVPEEGAAFVIDSTPRSTDLDISEESGRKTEVDVPKKKVMKRRNQSLYAQNQDE